MLGSPPVIIIATIMSSASATMTDSDSGKRKASVAGISSHNRPVKRRASKACCCCRARKVRCDVVENGSPCTNCRLDQVECIVTESKRRKFVIISADSRMKRKTSKSHSMYHFTLTSAFSVLTGSRVSTWTPTTPLSRPARSPRRTRWARWDCMACQKWSQPRLRRTRSISTMGNICLIYSVRNIPWPLNMAQH